MKSHFRKYIFWLWSGCWRAGSSTCNTKRITRINQRLSDFSHRHCVNVCAFFRTSSSKHAANTKVAQLISLTGFRFNLKLHLALICHTNPLRLINFFTLYFLVVSRNCATTSCRNAVPQCHNSVAANNASTMLRNLSARRCPLQRSCTT